MTRPTLYVRLVAVILLSCALGVAWSQDYFTLIHEVASERQGGAWLYAMLLAAAIGLELRLLMTAARWVRAGGRTAVFLERERSPEVRARRRVYRLRLAASLLSTLAALVFCEIAFRVFNIVPPPPPPSVQSEWESFDKSVNALGLREPWDSIPPDDRRLRVAFLGDSITFGDNVEREEAFCHLVEDMITPDVPEGVITINLGYRGTDPAWQLDRYRPLRDVLRPDVVVQVVYPNDLGIRMEHRLDEIYRLRDNDLWVGTWSYVLTLAERRIRHHLAWKRTIDYFRGGRTSAEREAAWAKFRRDLVECKNYVEEGGAVYAVVLFPWFVRLNDYLLPDVHARMASIAKEWGVPYLDLLDVFAGRDAETLRVSLANEHPNAAGHRLAAEHIAAFLREDVLPRRTRP